jgi:diguanylate cyclase (GGDEF)-like protein
MVAHVLPHHPPAGPETAARRLVRLIADSQAAHDGGQHQQGLALAEQALEGAVTLGDPLILARVHTLLANHRWRLGLFEPSVQSAREALALWRAAGRIDEQCDTLCLLAISFSEIGLQEEALKHATASFELARTHQRGLAMGVALNRIGICYDRLGDSIQAESFLLQSLGMAREHGGHGDRMLALNNLTATAISAYYQAQLRADEDASRQAVQRARQYGGRALSLARRHGDVYRVSVTQGNLGEALGLAGEYAEARALLQEALASAVQNGFRAVVLRMRHNIAEVLLREGRNEEAITELTATLQSLTQLDHETTRMRVHSALHRAYKAVRQFEPALLHCEAHHQIEMQRVALQSKAQARLMVNRIDVERALMDGERSRLEAELQRLRTQQLEAEKELLEQRTAELHRETLEDPLTGLANRRHVDATLPLLIERSRGQGQPMALAMADLDHFKQVNDRHGHAAGDEVLRTVARLFGDKTRARDLLGRWGGEEFVLVFVDTPRETAHEICERLRSAVQAYPWSVISPGLQVTLSLGLADAQPADNAIELVERADAALYEAKRLGRNRLVEG